MKRKKIFIAIAFGTSVRDVLRNDAFRLLKEDKNLDIVLFAQDLSDRFVSEFGGDNIFFEKLVNYKPSFTERILLHFHKAVLRNKCRTIDLGNTGGDTRTLDKFTPFAKLLTKVFGYYTVTRLIFWLYKTLTHPTLYKEEFDRHKPDLVIVTRVLNYSMDYPLMRRASKENVPVISLVSSWDNFTSKAFFPFSLHSLVVWNYVMKEEAVDLFGFPPEKVYVSGIPRYDLLFTSKFCDRETYFKKFNLDLNKKLILYCTGSATTGTSPVDPTSPQPEIAEYIATQVRANKFSQPVQLMIRLHPQAEPRQYQKLIDSGDVIVHVPGNKSAFHDRLFTKDDDMELAESLIHADVVVNLASTVTIDAAVFNTPIICENFDIRGERPLKMSFKKFYEFDHFAKLKETGGFELANSIDELISLINLSITNPQHLTANRKEIVKQQCVYTDGKSGRRIANYIQQVLSTLP